VLTFSTLGKHNEIVAMRSSGIAPLRLVGPIFLLGCIGGLLLLVAQEYLLPYTHQAYRLLWRTRMQHEPMAEPQEALRQGQWWYRAGSRIWSVEVGLPSAHRLLGVSIYELDASGMLQQRYDAAEARWTPQGWTLLQGVQRTFSVHEAFIPPPDYFAQRLVNFAERFADMHIVRQEPAEMGLRALLAYAAQLQRQGEPAAEYLIALHGKLAFAVLCVFMAGFGVPLALRLNRSGGTIRAIGLTLLCGFGYWVVHSLVLALGYNGQLPPLAAAWSTSAGFGVATVYLASSIH
jgi:lipopolysaccharide export system permease protein